MMSDDMALVREFAVGHSEPAFAALVGRHLGLVHSAAALQLTEDAAQKRVTRALDKLRGSFAKRGVALTGAAIAGAVSANAVQAVPVGLGAKITSAALVAGTTLATTLVMTTMQKAIIGATLAVAVGTGLYEARQAANARSEVQTLKQQRVPLAEQIRQLTQERDEATNLVAGLREEVERLNGSTAELLRLRAEVGSLRQRVAEVMQRDRETISGSNRVQSLTLGEVIPKENWRDAGQASPESTVQTYWWAVTQGDAERLRRCMVFHDETNAVTVEYANHQLKSLALDITNRDYPIEAISLVSSKADRDSWLELEIGCMHRNSNGWPSGWLGAGSSNRPPYDFNLLITRTETNGPLRLQRTSTTQKQSYSLTKVGDEWKISIGSPPPGFLGIPIGDPDKAAKIWSQISPELLQREDVRTQISPEALQLILQLQSEKQK